MNKSYTDDAINNLLKTQQLPNSYLDTVNIWLKPIASTIANRVHPALFSASEQKNAPKEDKKRTKIVLGIQGSQGSGKSTCSLFLKALLESQFNLKAAVLSLDDFYLTQHERKELAQTTHPLLITRGVPGTHDVKLAIDTINDLKHLEPEQAYSLPRFDKSIDDRAAPSVWEKVTGSIDVIILEGWFTGLEPQTEEVLIQPINLLEQEQDQDGTWRKFVNDQLANTYQSLFKQLDLFLVLKAPSFDCVYQWRLKQESKLIASLSKQGLSEEQEQTLLTPEKVKAFVAYFERLTTHALETLPNKADWCFYLDSEQNITKQTGQLSPPSHVIFTDLDGTLLDHYSYSWSAAIPALNLAKECAIPIIINTSKTSSEVIELQKELNITAPFIVENGSALIVPQGFYSQSIEEQHFSHSLLKDGYFHIIFGQKRSDIVEQVYHLRDQLSLKFSGYSDWSIEKLMKITGLDSTSAHHSMDREYSEPLVWDDSDENFVIFSQAILEANLKILRGGRFIHILGDTNKAKPMNYIMNEVYQNPKIQSICLGDSHNDIDMLNAADFAVCVKSPTGNYPKLNHTKSNNQYSYHTEGLGPIGWNEAIKKILSQ